MKLIYIFLVILPMQLVSMDRPLRVKAAAAAWPPLHQKPAAVKTRTAQKPAPVQSPKPAAAGFLAKKSAAGLKRSSDEEESAFQRRRRRSADALDTIMPDAPRLVAQPSAQSLIDEVKQQVREGMLNIISTNPPVCEVIRQQLPWRCRQGCRAEFTDHEAERRHIHSAHNIVAASNEDMQGIDWEAIGTLAGVSQSQTASVPEEGQQEEEVEEIM